MNKKIYPLFAIVLLGSFLVGCVDDFDRNYEFDEYTPSVILKAKHYIESGQVDFSLLDMKKAYANDPEYAVKSNNADYSIKWGDYRIKTENNEDVVFVPIKINKKKNQAFSLLTEEGRFKGGSHQIYITIMLREGDYGDKGFDAAIGTYMYGHNMKDADVMRMGLDFESADYNGYFIVSALDGRMLTGRFIEDGKTKALFVQNPQSPKERKAQAKVKAKEIKNESEGDTINKNKKHEHLHIFLNYVPNRVFKKTKSGGDDIEWIITHCPECGELWDDCDCYTVTTCSHCGENLNTNNLCPYACSWCGVCMYGNSSHTHNTPPSYPPSNPGTGGGGGPSGPTPDPDPDPEPDPEPEPEPMSPKDIAKGRIVDIFFNDTPYLRDYSETADPPCGWCLTGWRTVWGAAGLDCPPCEYAKDYGPILIQLGFEEIPVTWNYADEPTESQYKPQIGDTRVWDTYPGQRKPAGHIDWYNGQNWVSDFRQNNKWWPGQGYRTHHPSYKIYR